VFIVYDGKENDQISKLLTQCYFEITKIKKIAARKVTHTNAACTCKW